ncbi:hypothetical protein CRUP_037174, partial [Coryphaenoides rupestris]
MYSSLKDPFGGGVCGPPLSLGAGLCSSTSLSLGGGVCGTPPLSSGLLPSHMSALSFPSVPAGSTSSYSLTSSQPFANCFSSAPSLPPLLSQAQTSLPESDLDDCRFPCQANSPTESLSSQSPMSCLPLLFDHRDGAGLGLSARPENVPAASAHIELLLEKHGNGEMGDQILGLAAKKERLQLLNVELAVPFPPHATGPRAAHINFLSSAH